MHLQETNNNTMQVKNRISGCECDQMLQYMALTKILIKVLEF